MAKLLPGVVSSGLHGTQYLLMLQGLDRLNDAVKAVDARDLNVALHAAPLKSDTQRGNPSNHF